MERLSLVSRASSGGGMASRTSSSGSASDLVILEDPAEDTAREAEVTAGLGAGAGAGRAASASPVVVEEGTDASVKNIGGMRFAVPSAAVLRQKQQSVKKPFAHHRADRKHEAGSQAAREGGEDPGVKTSPFGPRGKTSMRTFGAGAGFGGASDKCAMCGKSAYAAERLVADKKIYHKSCFRYAS